MKKIKQVLAMTAIVCMGISAILTLIFALLTNFKVGNFTGAWKASAWCMVIFPVMFYAIILVAKVLNKRNDHSDNNIIDHKDK